MKTISRIELIDCIIFTQKVHEMPVLVNKMRIKMQKLSNFQLCDMMYEWTGHMMQPKTSQILEFLN